MFTRIIFLAALLAALSGCQPESSKQATMTAEGRLADKTGCFQCHTTGKNLLGPAWEAVSERYRNNPDAVAHLMNKIKNGGSGAWISKDMPAFKDELVSEENRKLLSEYIMTLK